MRLRDRLARFMQGRYGSDQFNQFLLVLAVILMVLSFFISNGILNLLVLVLIVYIYFRMLSRNISKRYAENQKYLQLSQKPRDAFARFRYRFRKKTASAKRDAQVRKTHHIYKCPQCGQRIKVPKGKGKIAIRCPKCGTEFIKKS